MMEPFKLSILKGLILSQCNINLSTFADSITQMIKVLLAGLEKKSLLKNKVNQCNTSAHKTHGQKKSQNDFWLLIDMNLDFDLATHFHHTVWRDLIEITHWTGITLHRNKQFFTPWRHSITHGMNQTIT